MDVKNLSAGVLAVLLLAVGGFVFLTNSAVPAPLTKINWNTGASVESSDSSNLEITVYNPVSQGYYASSSVGLVKDTRKVSLSEGVNLVSTRQVAKTIDPTSIYLNDLTDAQARVLEQNYDYDLVSNAKILEKYVDKTITVKSGNETFSGKLLSFSGDSIILQNELGITTLNGVSLLSFPLLPEGLITKPTINLIFEAAKTGEHELQMSYLAQGISWKANYVAVTNKDDSKVDLQGWVSVTNNAGATFKDAKLKLVAGDINLVRQREQSYDEGGAYKAMASAPAPQFKEETLFEYHLYDLQRPTTINDNQVKQIGLIEAKNVPVEKKFVFDSSESEKVQVKLEFSNDEKSNLGLPLPKGTFRLYKPDSSGQLQFLGEDAIDHTAKDEKIKLSVGNAFDVVAEKNVKSQKQLDRCTDEYTNEVKVRNHKAEPVTVDVVESIYGDWTITQQSLKGEKESAYKNTWHVAVQPNSESVLTYTVQSKQRYYNC